MKSSARKSSAPSFTPPPVPTQDDIAAAAKLLWIEKGRPENCDTDIWLEAERRLHAPAARSNGGPAFRTSEASTGNTETAMEELDDLYPDSPGRGSTAL
jgi:Protein of unknown function (DUF2934)